MDVKRKSTEPVNIRGKFPGDRRFEDDGDEALTSGVPLVKLIKRNLIDSPELVMLGARHSVAAERFRRLKARLINEHADNLGVMVITSATAGDGKSLVAINTALAFAADMNGEVLLIDADLRRSGIARWLEPTPKFGFSEILGGKTELEHALIELENAPLKILPAGSPTRDPVELLSSERADNLFLELRRRFKYVIVDTPPIVPFTDADVLGRLSDGVLLVARNDMTLQSLFRRAVESVTSTDVLGIVLNDATFNLADRGHYHGHDGYYQEQSKK
jgi:protein-tyrosine kinase